MCEESSGPGMCEESCHKSSGLSMCEESSDPSMCEESSDLSMCAESSDLSRSSLLLRPPPFACDFIFSFLLALSPLLLRRQAYETRDQEVAF